MLQTKRPRRKTHCPGQLPILAQMHDLDRNRLSFYALQHRVSSHDDHLMPES